MTDFEKDNVKQLVARLKEIQKQSDVTIPGWMLDENRYGKGSLTLEEQHDGLKPSSSPCVAVASISSAAKTAGDSVTGNTSLKPRSLPSA
jgi:hypothetical protein